MKIFVSTLLILAFGYVSGQEIIKLDATKLVSRYKETPFKMGNNGPAGKEIKLNSLYMSIGEKPVVPVMAEMQYSRIPRESWEDLILKMKACGVTIVASYVFWNHHEYIEGQFDWQGNKDLREFVKLCGKHGLYVYPRIGPWVHGEARNGGTPDWILQKKNIADRWQHPVYENYVDRLYYQISQQLKGLLYKDGGPVIGVQFENEYARAKDGEYHIAWLKKTALKYGLDLPMYTVTGWGNGSVPPYEVIPLFGAYPDAPWADNIERSTDCSDFTYTSFPDYDKIGNNLQKKVNYMDYSEYSFFTCEMGVGIQNTYHRRLVISPIDGLILVNYKLGAGSNLIGYYIFAGGSQPHDPYYSNEENRDITGYWNDNPQISYDFQAAIKESGDLAPSYYEVKKQHYFLNEFGDRLAVTEPVYLQGNYGKNFSFRVKNNAGFLFGANYCRNNHSPELKNMKWNIVLKNEKIEFPKTPVNIEDSAVFIWPVNFKMDHVLLKYATAQPLCKITNEKHETWVFFQNINALPEFCFDDANISAVTSQSGKVEKSGNRFIVSNLIPSKDCFIELKLNSGQLLKILVLSKQESKQVWLFDYNGKKEFFIADADLYMNNGTLTSFGKNNNFLISSLTADSVMYINNVAVRAINKGQYRDFKYSVPVSDAKIEWSPIGILEHAQWLQTSVLEVKSNTNQQQKFFVKEFNIGNTSAIRNVHLFLALEHTCRLFVNFVEVKQTLNPYQLNDIDLTGYLKPGENVIYLAFPLHDGNKAFAARLMVDFFNTDRFEAYSDISWQTHEDIRFPTWYSKLDFLKSPVITTPRTDFPLQYSGFTEYKIHFSPATTNYVKNNYLLINYNGDKAQIRMGHLLVGDDFNSNVLWNFGLQRLGNSAETTDLILTIYPFVEGSRVYFDIPMSFSTNNGTIDKLQLQNEYGIKLMLNNSNQ